MNGSIGVGDHNSATTTNPSQPVHPKTANPNAQPFYSGLPNHPARNPYFSGTVYPQAANHLSFPVPRQAARFPLLLPRYPAPQTYIYRGSQPIYHHYYPPAQHPTTHQTFPPGHHNGVKQHGIPEYEGLSTARVPNLGSKVSGKENHSIRNMKQAKTRRKRSRLVRDLSQWEIPSDRNDKHAFVCDSIRNGLGPVGMDLGSRFSKSPRRKRKQRSKSADNESKGVIHPNITGAAFDKRFLDYDRSSCGIVEKERLVRIQSMTTIPLTNHDRVKFALENNCVEKIPDEPSRNKSSSRVGPRYQAQVAPTLQDECSAPTALPGYDVLWDPKLAREAEQRGENISEFLGGENDLRTQELLLSTLHKNGYSVDAARLAYEKQKPSNPSLTREECKEFELLIHTRQKQFSTISKALHRSVSDCLVHYYRWKVSNPYYAKAKSIWKDNQHCCVCDDGGDLLVCDGCNAAFHLSCATPPLKSVPEGQWFCHSCEEKKRIGLSVLSPLCAKRRRPTLRNESSPTR